MALATPTKRGRSHVPPLSGVKPRAANGSQSRASFAAMQKSDAEREVQPEPGGPAADGADDGRLRREDQRDQPVGLCRQPPLDAPDPRPARRPWRCG